MRNYLPMALACLTLTACATTADSDLPALQDREWRVTQMGGEAVIPNSRAEIRFGAESRFEGNASCNRMFGSYRLDGSGLTLSRPGLTRMLCQPAEMEQERKLTDLLEQVASYRIDTDGSLRLMTRTGVGIVAER